MTPRRLNVLQWFGLLGAPFAWAGQLVAGYFVAEAHCEASHWGNGWSPTVAAITVAAAIVAVLGEVAAARTLVSLRGVTDDESGPHGRQHFFAIGGLVGNVLFFTAILLSGITVVSAQACRPA